ncbi:MAG: anthranilate phosphoribosyltransferase [Armatimonadota bacterium]|nr:anthranilate phosphoribosyltransferase [Armatimonadota bacterium]MDR7449537.1 anthranilate phosphoribosyltransferase [Armatimonadota bacterium]MDR7460069.1 anthranilate phosphoribosyltransferase [Armatimonadota bacterium]MDR7478704.1 anthranilate phosphoribosyltransferase [Armatimonadota bacterium]MDR7487968.1 anthranilate phosphoribosyltransferase [Armatimonadota bacterium]
MELKEAIRKAVERQDLSEAEAHDALGVIMDGQATPAQIAALITALRMKGETVEEIAGFARGMRERAQRIRPRVDGLVDVVGTGGDRISTFNVSTTAAFVVAGAGAYVAKHGNRAVSRRCGAADVLEALGVNIQVAPEVVERCVEDIGMGFLFAPLYHPAMKHAVGPRREIGIRTVFNILGPLTNPAGARHLLVGVYDPALTELLAQVLLELGVRRALVVHGDGMDEVSTLGPTRVAEARDGRVRTYTVEPESLGLPRPAPEAIAGGAPEENARVAEAVLRGERGAPRDLVLLNAAAGLVAADLAEDLREGLALAVRAVDSGAAYERLEALRARTRAEAVV